MSGNRTPGTSLSTRVTLIAFVTLTASALLIALTSIAGVLELSHDEQVARLHTESLHVANGIEYRIESMHAVARTLLAHVEHDSIDRSTAGPDRIGDLLPALAASDQLALIELGERPTTVLAIPEGTHVPSEIVSIALGIEPGTAECTSPAPRDDARRLWVVHRADVRRRRFAVVVATGLEGLLGGISRPSEEGAVLTSMIIDRSDVPLASRGGEGIDSVDCGMLPDHPSVNIARATDGRGTGLVGAWSPIRATGGMGWRVATMQPVRLGIARVRSALAPAGITMVVASVLAVLFVLLYSRTLTVPLQMFERRARDVTSGSHARPVRVDREDELGRLGQAFNEMGARLNAFQDVSRLLASASDPEDVLDAVLDSLGHLLGTGDVIILLADPNGSTLEIARARGLVTPSTCFSIPLGADSPPALAFRSRSTIVFGSEDEGAGRIYQLFAADTSRTAVAEPLMTGVTVLGTIVVVSPGRRPFTATQLETLTVFSGNAAVAVRTSRLFADEQRSREEAETMRVIAELMVRRTDLDRSLEHAAEAASELLGYGEWSIALEERQRLGLEPAVDPEGDRLLMSAWRSAHGSAPEDDAEGVSAVIDIRSPGALAALLPEDWCGALLIPLSRGGAVRGVLALFDRERAVRSSRRALAVAGTIGKELSLAIQNAFLLQQAHVRAANLETVFHISQAVSSELQVNVVLNRVLDVVHKILSADAVALMSYDRTREVIETSMTRGIADREMLYMRVKPGVDIPGRVFETSTPMLHGNLSRGVSPIARLASSQGFESLIAVPLMARGRPIGVLTVYSRVVEAFSAEDMELLLTFASQAALAIDTAFLYGREHQVASILQSSILPDRLPDIPGYDASGFYVPSGPDAHIGGDYYDVFTMPDGRTVIAIGDVCGKGVVAATKTSAIKYTLRGLIGAGAGPGEALAELNRQVTATGDPSDIVTVWIGVLDRSARRLMFANGGHPPGLLMRSGTRRIQRLCATGPLLGAAPGIEYGSRAVDIEAGDLLLLYTDGVTEARRGKLFFGEGRVRRVLKGATTSSDCIDHLLMAVRTFAAGPLSDDAAAVAIRCCHEPQVGDGGQGSGVG